MTTAWTFLTIIFWLLPLGLYLRDDKWDERCDFNCDGSVDFLDNNLLAANFGEIGDEMPPAQMLGMNFLPRPNAPDTTFVDYDWTGLNVIFSLQYPGVAGWQPDITFTHQYGGNANGAGWDWATSFGDFGYGTFTNAAKIEVTGTSTYKWKWTPPIKRDAQGVELGIPDLQNFPVPNRQT